MHPHNRYHQVRVGRRLSKSLLQQMIEVAVAKCVRAMMSEQDKTPKVDKPSEPVNENRMTTEEAGEYLRYAANTLRNWRAEGRGPAYVKVGRLVWYHKEDLDRWNKQVETVIKPRKLV